METTNHGEGKVNLTVTTNSKRKKILKRVAIVLGVVLVIGVVLFIISYPGIKAFTTQLKVTNTQLKKVSEAWQLQDVIKAKTETVKLETEIKTLDDKLNYFSWANPIPFVGGYYRDGHHFLKAGEYGSQAGVIIADSLIPFADALGLKGGAVGNAEIYMQKVVDAMPKIVPSLDDIEAEMKLVRGEIDQVNYKKYPEKIGSYTIRPNIENAVKLVDQVEGFMPQLRPILLALPTALGSPTPKTYLILFQNDKELRSTGGFITAYATAQVQKGKLVSIHSEDIYRLDDRVNYRPALPSQLRDYLKVNKFWIRDSNTSPDFEESMNTFASMYKSAGGAVAIDGIVGIDTEFVRAILAVVGDVHTTQYNETFSAAINPTYQISDVVYKLELYSEQLLMGKDNRKDLIGDLMNALVKKVLTSDKKKWPGLLQAVQQMAEQKHIVAYSYDKSSQVLLEKYNYAGRVQDYSGDYLSFNSNNYAGLKGDLYVTQKIDQDIQISSNGTVTKKVTFTNTNPHGADGWLNPTVYTNWLRLYVPTGSKLVDGSFNGGSELGKQMWQTLLKTVPKSSSSVTFTYQLPFKVKKGDIYKMLIQKQPGTGSPEVNLKLNGKALNVDINGKKTSKFNLDTDREISFKVP